MSEKTTQKRPVRGSAVVGIVIWSLVFCLLGLILLGSVTGIHTEIDVFGLPGVHLNLGGFTYKDADEYTVGDASISDTVSDLEINWLEGSIAIIPSDTDEIRITEEYGGDDSDLRLRWRFSEPPAPCVRISPWPSLPLCWRPWERWRSPLYRAVSPSRATPMS